MMNYYQYSTDDACDWDGEGSPIDLGGVTLRDICACSCPESESNSNSNTGGPVLIGSPSNENQSNKSLSSKTNSTKRNTKNDKTFS